MKVAPVLLLALLRQGAGEEAPVAQAHHGLSTIQISDTTVGLRTFGRSLGMRQTSSASLASFSAAAVAELQKARAATRRAEARAHAAEKQREAEALQLDEMEREARAAQQQQADSAARTAAELAASAAKLAKAQAALNMADAAAHRDHVGLLLQVNDLQENQQALQKRADKAERALVLTQEQDTTQLDSLRQAEGTREAQQLSTIAKLRALLNATRAQSLALSSEASRKAAAKIAQMQKEESSYVMAFNAAQEQLRAATANAEDLEAARDAALKKLGKNQQQLNAEAADEQRMRANLESAQSAVSEAQSHVTVREAAIQKLKGRVAELNKELAVTRKAGDAQTAKAEQAAHDTAIAATEKVRNAEDESEGLKAELQKVKSELITVTADEAKAKDAALREADEALAASHKVDDLNTKLAAETKAADEAQTRAEDLLRARAQLQTQRDTAVQQLGERTRQGAAWKEKVDDLTASSSATNDELHKAEAQVSALQSKASILEGAEQRADALGGEVADLRGEISSDKQKNSKMLQQLKTLRDLNDQYSKDSDQLKAESSNWKSKADDLQAKLEESEAERQRAEQQRAEAVQRAKEASSREDTYFDDDSHLQAQSEALQSQLNDALAYKNKTALELDTLRAQVSHLEDEKQRESESAHAAWVATENELLGAKRDAQAAAILNSNLQADLAKARSVLTDKQRAVLGLPPVKAGKAAAGAPPPTVQALAVPVAPTAPQVAHLTTPSKPLPQRLLGEPRRPAADDSLALAAVDAQDEKTPLQKLTEYFDSPSDGGP